MGALDFLYGTVPGRLLLAPLLRPGISRACGAFLETGTSKLLIGPFVRSTGIDTADYDLSQIHSFNDFFCRPLKPDRRPVDRTPEALIAPCDAWLTALPVTEGMVLPVKQSRFSLARMLDDRELAASFEGGWCLVFRLCVEHYHRYCWIDGGTKRANVYLPGLFHTVRPVALEKVPVFTENAREYAVLESENFGTLVQMEIGALLVGKICNERPGPGQVLRGQEKGHFAFGGSTLVVLLRKGAVELPPELLRASERGIEQAVKMGQRIGVACGQRD